MTKLYKGLLLLLNIISHLLCILNVTFQSMMEYAQYENNVDIMIALPAKYGSFIVL